MVFVLLIMCKRFNTSKMTKQYILIYYLNGKQQEVSRGSCPLLKYKKVQLEKQPQYKNGKLTIISETGLKYNTNYIKKQTP